MTRKTINVGQAQIGSGQNAGHCRRYMFLDKGWDGPIENHAEALRIDIPAHDVERVGPGVLADHFDGRNARFVGSQHARRGAIAKQRRCDNICLGQEV